MKIKVKSQKNLFRNASQTNVKRKEKKNQLHQKKIIKNTQNSNQEDKTKIIYVRQTLQEAIERVRKQQQAKNTRKKQILLNNSQISKFSKVSKNIDSESKISKIENFSQTHNKLNEDNTVKQKQIQAKKISLLSISQSKEVQIQYPAKQQNQNNAEKKDLTITNQKDIKSKGIQKELNQDQNPQSNKNPENVKPEIHSQEPLSFVPVSHRQNQYKKKSSKTQFSNNKITTRSYKSLINSQQNIAKSMAQRLQERKREAKQKIMKNKVNLLQNQTKFKLQKKIKQNLQLVQKKQLLSQFFYSKLQWQKQRDQSIRKKRQEQRLLHETNQMKIQMLKRLKKRTKKSQLQQCRSRSQQSLLNLQFSKTMKERQKQQKKDILVERYRFLKNKNKSLMNFRSQNSTQNRLHTTQTVRKTFFNENFKTAREKY